MTDEWSKVITIVIACGDTFTLPTDASDVGLGAVLSTTYNDVVEYASRATQSYKTVSGNDKGYCEN